MTDAIHAEAETQRALAADDAGGALVRCGAAADEPPVRNRR
jgi:hypothetical protein